MAGGWTDWRVHMDPDPLRVRKKMRMMRMTLTHGAPRIEGPLASSGKGGHQGLGYRLRGLATAPSAAQDAAGGSRADPTRRGDERRGMRLEICVTNRPCFGRYSQLHPEAYWGLLMLAVISVSTRLPVSSVVSACYCPDGHCVFKSVATSRYDRSTSSASTAKYVHACLLRATMCRPVRVNH